jgi:hypothetical protein
MQACELLEEETRARHGIAGRCHFGVWCLAETKLSGNGAVGAPEGRLRVPLDTFSADMAAILALKIGDIVVVGE